ncbi:MAG TPA: 3-hydroxyacyl-CoA dehydrogenase NAD-binding domain-containing protein [Longimicrobiaceae bacterium]|nr:3-hydroxyacyl-CoA dehydrogenase NAD-binding domain-containing protein [Longimicrobiaceae bacterium]
MDTGSAGREPLRLELEEEGIARLVMDRPAGRVNLLSSAVVELLDALLSDAERLAAEGRLRALVLRSARPGVFVAGVDLEELRRVEDAAAGTARVRRGQAVLRRLEQLPVPTFAAVEGACLGAGVELALACSYRLAALDPATRFAFPEVRLGLLPALGGTVRLPRLVGVREALEMVVGGRAVDAAGAVRLGLADAAFPAEGFEAALRRFVLERLRRGRLRTGPRRGVARRLVEDTAPGRRVVFARVRRELAREGGGHPAALRALEAVADGVALPLEQAFEREAEAAGELLVSGEARGLLHAFRLRREARRGVEEPGAPGPERAAVLGAGRTGTGVAYLLAAAGVPVRLRETRHPALVAGLERLRALFREGVRQGRLGRREAEERAPLVVGTLGYGGFGTVDVVLEATRADPERKRAALREAEEHVREGCILAATGAAATVTALQAGLEHPERLVGMHFVPPVAWGELVEVVRGERTSKVAAAAAAALARRLGRVPLVVRDRPGFLVYRLLLPCLHEALRLLEEGAAIERVDAAMAGWGMPPGPLRLIDELGLARVARLSRLLAEELGERMRPPPLLDAVAEAARAAGSGEPGFYRYDREREPRVTPAAAAAARAAAQGREGGLPVEEMRSRMVLPMVNEAARALEEGVVDSPGEVDLAMLLGAGFPAPRGGPLFHADALGTAAVAAVMEEHALRFGERFAPAPLLRRLADAGRGFYDAAEPAPPLEALLLDTPPGG